MAEEGFKRKLTAILSADLKYCSRLMPGPDEPMLHKLTPFSTYRTNIGQQYWFPEFFGQMDVMTGSTGLTPA